MEYRNYQIKERATENVKAFPGDANATTRWYRQSAGSSQAQQGSLWYTCSRVPAYCN